jgi:hypothetical protein
MGRFDVNIQLQNYQKKNYLDSNHFIIEKGGGIIMPYRIVFPVSQ